MAPTMDIEIVRELFTRTLDAGRILKEDDTFLKQVKDARDKLPPFSIGKLGQLQESGSMISKNPNPAIVTSRISGRSFPELKFHSNTHRTLPLPRV